MPRSRSTVVSVGFGATKSVSLKNALTVNGLAEYVSAFAEQDVQDVEIAMGLSLEEVRTIMSSHGRAPTVGAVHNCHRILAGLDTHSSYEVKGTETAQFQRATATPQSVLSRSLLNLNAEELKAALNARVNAETIFASLMLTVAAGALIETPDPEVCIVEFGSRTCDGLQRAYLIAWGIASAGFSMASLVSLGSMQLFFGHASAIDVHDRFIGGETYLNLAHNFISGGLLAGLLPGLCLNLFMRFPEFPWACGIVSLFHWILWFFQLLRGIKSVRNIYAEFPGFGTICEFFQGYNPLGRTITLIPVLEPKQRQSVHSDVESICCKPQNGANQPDTFKETVSL